MVTLPAVSLIEKDLHKSGIEVADTDAYIAQEAELSAVGLKPHLYLSGGNLQNTSPGYIIPYYDISGARAPFYRLKLFNPTPKGARYLQPGNVGSWVYFPKNFGQLLKTKLKQADGAISIIITEGEKKAAKAVREGFLACGLGGIYNWRCTTMVFPEGTELVRNRNNEIVAKIKGDVSEQMTSDRRGVLANGMQQLINLATQHNMQLVIAFDADFPANPNVQKAAAELAFELRFNGVPTQNIRQMTLETDARTKMGLDDFMVYEGVPAFAARLKQTLEARNAFPCHPNLAEQLGKMLDGKLSRAEIREMTLMILSDMDRNGIRMIEKATSSPYYFDNRSKVLMPVNLLHHHETPLHETRFGKYLYKQFDIAQADHKLIGWLAAAFTGEEPVEEVIPQSVYKLNDQGLAYQLDDGHYIQVTADPKAPVIVRTNGSNGLLFRADQVEPIEAGPLVREILKQIEWIKSKPKYEEFYWARATSEFKFLKPVDAKIMAVLSYLSPWLQRWRGTQLPVELMIGEPGSGKSSMYALRMAILTGWVALRNQPTDIRDWYASISSQNGMHVTDNVAFATKELKQRISDEICRIVTEPKPTVEMRQLFTTSQNTRIPVHVVFALTAINQPFVNADIMQRSVIMELSAIGDNHATDWMTEAKARHGGRLGWLAHHLAMMHVFFEYVQNNGWNDAYKSQHRLANFEQLFGVMAKIMNMPDADEVRGTLSASSQAQVSEHDWTMEALKAYCVYHLEVWRKAPNHKATCYDISSWAQDHEDFGENAVVTNPRRLARYIKSHMHMVTKLAGLVEDGKYENRQTYKVVQVQ